MRVSRQRQLGHIEMDGWDAPPTEGWWPRFIRWLGGTPAPTPAPPSFAPEIKTCWVGGTPCLDASCACSGSSAHRLEDRVLHFVRDWWQDNFRQPPVNPITLDTDLHRLGLDSLDMIELYASLEEGFDIVADFSATPYRVAELVELVRNAPHPMLEVA